MRFTNNYKEKIKKIVEEINLIKDPLEEFEMFSPHCLRHTFATRSLEAGMKPKTLQTILGHKTLKMTMDTYVHVLDKLKEDDMRLLEERMDAIDMLSEHSVEKDFQEFQQGNEKVIRFAAI